jgi:hypothetical protein
MVKKALLVGINDYSPCRGKNPQLNGCVNDVRDMATTMRDLGFVPASLSNMHIVTDCRATRDVIMKELGWLVHGAKKGDMLIFYFSGYGSQQMDCGDEVDKKDETICPHDFASAGMIRDDDLRAIFSGISQGVNLEVILDSCYSGTGSRELALLSNENIPGEDTIAIRYFEPPLDFGFFLEDPTLPTRRLLKLSPELMQMSTDAIARVSVVAPTVNHVLWSGCKDNQTSVEVTIGGAVRGIFTYCFCKSLRRMKGNISRRDLHRMLASCLKEVGASQTPQLDGIKAAMLGNVFNTFK